MEILQKPIATVMISVIVVDSFAQLLTRFEVWHIFAGQRHGITGLRVAADPWGTKMQRKTPKATNFDPLATRQRFTHLLQHGLDRLFHVLIGNIAAFARENFD